MLIILRGCAPMEGGEAVGSGAAAGLCDIGGV